MDLQLKGRTALITGASQGIGRAIARMLASEGVKIAAVARRKPLLEELAAEIARAQDPAPALIVQDVMAPDAAERIRDQAIGALGKVEILVNCAGGSRPLPIDAGEDRWEEAMTLNFTRVRQLTQAILPGMMERKWGRIVCITGKSEPDRAHPPAPRSPHRVPRAPASPRTPRPSAPDRLPPPDRRDPPPAAPAGRAEPPASEARHAPAPAQLAPATPRTDASQPSHHPIP